MEKSRKIKIYHLKNFREIPQIKKHLTEEQKFDIEVVGSVLPFKVNNYVIDELIDWENFKNDPVFILTFPQKNMLDKHDFNDVAYALKSNEDHQRLKLIIARIHNKLNPHPAGQMEKNVPVLDGTRLMGIQHKYDQTMLFFPKHGQTCHAYCTFCFRWPQFIGNDEMKFAMRETELTIRYLKKHPEITDILFTGGDPMSMSANRLKDYILPILEADLPHLKTIRIGTKSLSYWPYRYISDQDSGELLNLFKQIVDSGKHLAFMAHFNHYQELKTEAVKNAIHKIQETGAIIRTQSPLLKHINDSSGVWAKMWEKQVALGIIPYYMFMARDTGAHDYFAVPLDRAHRIFKKAYQNVSGIARTVRGPSMSTEYGKIHVLGVSEINNQKYFVLKFIQGRDSSWVDKPFFAKYNPDAVWIDDLEPAFDKEFFFKDEYIYKQIQLN